MGKISDALEKFETETEVEKLESSFLTNSKSGTDIKTLKKRFPTLRNPFLTKPDRNLVVHHDPLAYESEQFKMLRTMLLFPQSGNRAKTLMVTSALPGEGKSFVASNLAVSLAQNINEHVLLIDSDIRRPTMHSVFGFHDVPGLSEYLIYGTPLSSLLLTTMVEKLILLPAGTPPPNPSELLSSESMSNLIREVKNRYKDRYVVLDTPPPRLTAETAALARQVDGIILVIKSESTQKKMVEELLELLGKDKILGVVMNHHNNLSTKHYGYGKYGSHNAYNKKRKD